MKKKDIFIQTEISSCGACSIASILSFYDSYVPLEKIKIDTLTDKNGTSAYQLIRVLKEYGFNAFGMRIKLDQIKNDNLPAIVHITRDGIEHFLVIYNITPKEVITMDPAYGKKIYQKKEFAKWYDDIFIRIIPTANILKVEKVSALRDMIFTFFKKYKLSICLILLINIVLMSLSLINSLYLKISAYTNKIILLSLTFFILIIFKYISEYIKEVFELKLTAKIDKDINNNILGHVFHLKNSYISNKRVGEIARKVSDMLSIEKVVIHLSLITSLDAIILIIGSIILLIISKYLFILYFGAILIIWLFALKTKNKIYKNEVEVVKLYNSYYGNLIERLKGIESIKNLNKEDYVLNNIEKNFNNYLKNSLRLNRYNLNNYLKKNFIYELSFLFINTLGLLLIQNNVFNLLDLITFNSLFNLSISSLLNIINIIPEFMHTKAIFREVSEFLDVEEEKKTPRIKDDFKEIIFDNISYSYDFYHRTLNNINLRIKKGDKILINGASGTGKSTLVKCLTHLIDNYSGKITIDNIDMKGVSTNSIKNLISYVGQNEVLFSETIKENVCLGSFNKEHFDKILDLVELKEVLNKKAEKEETLLLEDGTNFSGGEKARIILARALYKNSPILIIDETLSSISETIENKILEKLLNIDSLTLIYITHRDKTSYFNHIINFRKDGTCEVKR